MKKYTYMDLLTQLGIGGAHPGGLKSTSAMLKDENITRETIILDAGCGTGQTASYLHQTYQAKVIALDRNPDMLNKARQRFDIQQAVVQAIEAPLEKIPLAAGTTDYVLAESVLSFVELRSAIGEIRRVLKEDGVLYALEATITGRMEERDIKLLKSFYGFQQLWREEEWAAAMVDAGFKEVKIQELPSYYDDEEPLTEFQLSGDVAPEIFELLNRHEELLETYRDTLGYRLIRAVK